MNPVGAVLLIIGMFGVLSVVVALTELVIGTPLERRARRRWVRPTVTDAEFNDIVCPDPTCEVCRARYRRWRQP